MTREEYGQYLRSPAWQAKRTERLRIDGFRCMKCRTSKRLEVHHLTYDRLGDEDVHRDLATLCHDDHAALHIPEPAFAEPPPPPLLTGLERALLAILSRDIDLADRFIRDGLLPAVREDLRPVVVSLGRSDWSALPDVPADILREAREALDEPWVWRASPEQVYETLVDGLRKVYVRTLRTVAMEKIAEAERAGRYDEVTSIAEDLQNLTRQWMAQKDSA